MKLRKAVEWLNAGVLERVELIERHLYARVRGGHVAAFVALAQVTARFALSRFQTLDNPFAGLFLMKFQHCRATISATAPSPNLLPPRASPLAHPSFSF